MLVRSAAGTNLPEPAPAPRNLHTISCAISVVLPRFLLVLPRCGAEPRLDLADSPQIQPCACKHNGKIEQNICPWTQSVSAIRILQSCKRTENSVVPPYVVVEDVERSSKCIPGRVLAVSTVPIGLRLHVSARLLREATGIRLTVLARWGWKDGQLVCRALHRLIVDKQR